MSEKTETAIQRWEREKAQLEELWRGSQWTEEQLAAIRAASQELQAHGSTMVRTNADGTIEHIIRPDWRKP